MIYEVGQKASFSKTITETDVYSFAGISGDFNPLHIDEIVAKESRFGRRIAYGALVASFISTVLGMYLPGSGTIYLKQESEFLKPVYIGDTIRAEVEIVLIDERRKCTLKTIVFNQNNEIVLSGSALVKLPLQKEL